MSGGKLAYTLYVQARGGVGYLKWEELPKLTRERWTLMAENADNRRKT